MLNLFQDTDALEFHFGRREKIGVVEMGGSITWIELSMDTFPMGISQCGVVAWM